MLENYRLFRKEAFAKENYRGYLSNMVNPISLIQKTAQH